MKILNTIQELWDYCSFCPICNENCRETHVSVGPDENFRYISHKKTEEFLQLKTKMILDNHQYFVTYKINCNDNSFELKFSAPNEAESSVKNPLSTYFYFYVQAMCNKCGYSYCNGSDIEIDQENKKVVSIGIEREGIYLIDHAESYHVILEHDKKLTNINKVYRKGKDLINLPPVYQCPIINVDMRQAQKAIRRIKTVLTFS